MLKEDALLGPILRMSIHDEVEENIQLNFRELLRHVCKNKDKFRATVTQLLELRTLAADWKDGIEPADPVLRGEKSHSNESLPPIPKRPVALSPTQLELARSLVFGILNLPRKKGMFGDKDLTDSHLKLLADFYDRSFNYPHLLNYSNTIREITDVGDLWYREFHLDLAKKLQFEIDASLTWSLADHILESSNMTLLDSVLYPLDIYNDAAQRALYSLEQQFLYSEIESEVNLAFEQLIFKFSEKSFLHYKQKAAVMMLDKDLRTQLETAFSDRIQRLHVPKSRLELLYRQRHIQLLGRTIDLNELVSQRVNQNLRANLKYAIARYEANPITAIIDLETLLNTVQLTHYLMVQDGLVLDPWEQLLNEANDSSSITSFQGRIVLHSLFEIVSDLTPNYIFNSSTDRFTRAPSLGRDEEDVPREVMPKMNQKFLYGSKMLCFVFSQIAELNYSFFGVTHLISLVNVVKKSSLSFC